MKQAWDASVLVEQLTLPDCAAGRALFVNEVGARVRPDVENRMRRRTFTKRPGLS